MVPIAFLLELSGRAPGVAGPRSPQLSRTRMRPGGQGNARPQAVRCAPLQSKRFRVKTSAMKWMAVAGLVAAVAIAAWIRLPNRPAANAPAAVAVDPLPTLDWQPHVTP